MLKKLTIFLLIFISIGMIGCNRAEDIDKESVDARQADLVDSTKEGSHEELPKADMPRDGASKEEPSKEEPSKEEPSKGNPQKEESPKEDLPKKDLPNKEAPKEDPPKKDLPNKETPKGDPPKKDLPNKETPKGDPPKKELPNKETPKGDPPKKDLPNKEAPKEDPPKKELPNREAPKEESPKKEVPKEEPSKDKLIVEKIPSIGNSEQVIIVKTSSANSFKANIETYEKVNGEWRKAFDVISGVVGRNGVNKQKEGDGKAPTGIFTFGTAFGTVEKPSGVKMPYRRTTDNDYWIDDVNSPDYNKWVTYEGDPKQKWNSFERLKISGYKYAVVINYNTSNIELGKGSAIFMHVWSSSSKGTSGCTAMAEANMLKILKWLDPGKKPIIIQGTQSWIESLAN